MTRAPGFEIALLCGGHVLWSLALVAIYALLSVGCALQLDATTIGIGGLDLNRTMLVALWALHLALLVALVRWLSVRWRRCDADAGDRSFVRAVSLAGAAIGLASTAWIGFPVLFLTQCL